MNVEILKPFVEGAAEVLEFEIKTAVEKGNLTLQKSALTTDDVTVLLNLVGEVYGAVLYCLSETIALKMVSRIIEQEFTEFDSMAQSGIAELGNVITGKAIVKLFNAGYRVDISPPTVITGKAVKISTLDFSRIVVPLKTDLGMMEIHLAVRENKQGQLSGSDDFIPLISPKAS
jgi:chemotaxis protein CheX